ncbi:SRPBCC family protein [Glaciihabitans sp. UYNi722]|uniref:SRPBCC family protein n=1 Tax=Glaciihabitans sp. UYNi722 TaxID=3156344 RepID=UPI003392BC5D
MSINVRVMRCSPDDVFRVLDDGWLFVGWVVGASRMRDVEDTGPAVGSQLHHSFGVWPLVINDATTVLEYSPPHHMVIQPKGWPIGEALVTIDIRPHRRGCIVRIQEEPVTGPARLIPPRLLNIALHIRNVETLRRLSYMAENRERAN